MPCSSRNEESAEPHCAAAGRAGPGAVLKHRQEQWGGAERIGGAEPGRGREGGGSRPGKGAGPGCVPPPVATALGSAGRLLRGLLGRLLGALLGGLLGALLGWTRPHRAGSARSRERGAVLPVLRCARPLALPQLLSLQC